MTVLSMLTLKSICHFVLLFVVTSAYLVVSARAELLPVEVTSLEEHWFVSNVSKVMYIVFVMENTALLV